MPALPLLLVIPAVILLLVWTIKQTNIISSLSALLFWVQMGIVVYVLMPVLSGTVPEFTLAKEFSISHLGASFCVLIQLVVASSMTHAHLFFQRDDEQASDRLIQLRIFYTCATLFLLAMTSVFFCNNLGFLWISVEATTLCSAPLVYFHRNKHALEAAWKYLMICSVGIAFALFGTMCIFASSQYGATPEGSLDLQTLISNAKHLQYPLLRLGFLFCLLGYGTKAGIFPLHGWLPDAYSESPAPASAMLSGGLLNCTLFSIFRVSEIVFASGHKILIENTAIAMGVITVLMASIFLIRQHGIKRLFAYSSIESAGLMLIAIGLDSGPLLFILALNHSAPKVALFLLSGNIIQATGTKSLNEIRGLFAANPAWAIGLLLGAFAVTGAPPFGAFAAEWLLLANGAEHNMWGVVAVLLIALVLSFLSVTMHVGKMVSGTPKQGVVALPVIQSSIIPAILILLSIICGLTSAPKLLW